MSTQPTGFNWLTLTSTIILAITAAINLFTVYLSYKNRQDDKKIRKLTLISELQKQYYSLLFELQNKVKTGELEPSDYSRRYWIDREYEFTLFRNGFIDENIYIQWLSSEKEDYKLDKALIEKSGKLTENYTYKKGYEDGKNYFATRIKKESNTKEFFKLMDNVFEPDTDSIEQAIDGLSKN